MKKILISFVLVFVLLSQGISYASKSKPNKYYDFENQSAPDITYSGKETQRFVASFEEGAGDREDNGYSYKVHALEHSSTNGNYQYTLSIPLGESDSSVVTTEFDLFFNITANPNAKEKVSPAFLVYLSNVNILWFNPTKSQSVQESWKNLPEPSPYNGVWNRFAITTDKAQGTFSVYFNGVPIVSNVSLPSTYSDDDCIKLEWNYWYNAPGADCWFAFDNVISYDGILTPDDKITWKTENGEIKSLSDITPGEKVSVTYEKYNYDGEDTELTAILLVRNGSKLVSARSKKVFVPVSDEPTIIEAEPVEIADTNGLEIKYVFLNSWEERVPVCKAFSLK